MNRSTLYVLSTVDDESRPNCKKETVAALESDVGFLGSINDIMTWERLKIYFKPMYKLKKIANKGAILVLVFNFSTTELLS